MEYRETSNLIEEALRDIERAEALTGEALTTDNTAIFAAIAQAKLLAIIANALNEMNQRYKNYYNNQP